jgi:hypothetical protein
MLRFRQQSCLSATMPMRFWQAVAAAGAAIVVVYGPAEAAEQKVRITGIYSDLYYNREDGDLGGTELFIVGVGELGYAAFIQHWEGGTRMPVVVPVEVNGNKVTFSVPAPSLGEGQYEGRITQNAFDGNWRHPLVGGGFAEDPIHLRRKKSYWQ